MMLTEAEAATKRCPRSFGPPFSEQGNAMVSSVSMMSAGVWTATQSSPTNCIGSLCMAWRIGRPAVPAYPGRIYKHFGGGREPFYEAGTERPAEPEKGFCGQFGRPFGGAA